MILKTPLSILLDTCHCTPCIIDGYTLNLYVLICAYSLWLDESNKVISFYVNAVLEDILYFKKQNFEAANIKSMWI